MDVQCPRCQTQHHEDATECPSCLYGASTVLIEAVAVIRQGTRGHNIEFACMGCRFLREHTRPEDYAYRRG